MGIKNGSFSNHLKLMYSQFVLYEINHSGKMEKTLFKQGGPFSTKAGIHSGPVSRYILYKKLQKYNMKVQNIAISSVTSKFHINKTAAPGLIFPLRHSEPFEMILPPRLLHKV